ncbi:MAG: FAD:protein FMN transferase [Gammaproteobacteria bacterium]|nr:MAG: FAD:protein FMN transferase [Gammaproteobacteria bacterium]
MPFWNSILLSLVALLLVTGCSDTDREAASTRFMVMGTLVDIAIWGEDKETAEKGFHLVEQTMHEINATWHAWRPSLLTRINQSLANDRSISVTSQQLSLIRRAKDLSVITNGYFDPATGALSLLWGFQQDDLPTGPPPDEKAIKAILSSYASIRDLDIHGNTISTLNKNIRLDFGAFAKGYAVDLAMEKLKQVGIRNAIINAGGDLRAIGTHGHRPWRIGVRDPRNPGKGNLNGGGILAAIETRQDESVFTSGDYERYYIYQGKRYHHILDPRTGYPSRDFTSVTVIYDNATDADALATALMVAGKAHWRTVANAMHAQSVMLIDHDNHVILTPTMQKRVRFLKQVSKPEIIAP